MKLKLKNNIVSLLFVIVCLFLSVSNCLASYGLYEDCILPWEFGEVNRTFVNVSPLGQRCKDICADQCGKFSNVIKGKTSQDSIIGAELNSDIIDNCLIECQNGNPFSSRMRVPSDNDDFFPWKWGDSQSIDAMCVQPDPNSEEVSKLSADYAYFSSGISVENGDKVSIYLGNPQNELGNNVYLCGFKTVLVEPSYFTLNEKNFQNKGEWNVRNTSPYDVKIKAKDGDYMNIVYGGEYESLYKQDAFLRNEKAFYIAPLQNIYAPTNYKLPSNDLLKVNINVDTDKDGNPTGAKMSTNPTDVYNNNQKYRWKGLNPRAYTNKRKSVVFSDGTKKENYTFDVFSYSGYLNGFSSIRSNVFLTYYNGLDPLSYLSSRDAVGGFVVQIKWRGCRHTDGELLQHAIAVGQVSEDTGEKQYDMKTLKDSWQDVSFDKDSATATITPNKSGMLFFKIKNKDDEGSHKRADASGQYKLIVHKEDKNERKALTGVLADLVNYIREIFVGDGQDQKGRVQVIFNNLVQDSSIINAIRALLVFYITFTGLSFMIGISPITQQEAIIRVVKIAVVITLISPKSWEFFNTYLFQLVMSAAMELIAKICAPFYDRPLGDPGNIEDLTNSVFYMFDAPFNILFAREIWIKVWSLVFTSLLGFAFAIIIVISFVIFGICIIKATMVYIISIITMSILFILAPLFISLILFKRTNQMFNYWIYQFFGIVLQPVLVFTSIALLFDVFKVALYASLSFAACKICWFGFYVPIAEWDICMLPGYMALYGGHFPPVSPFDAPIRMLAPIIGLILIAQGMYALCDFSSELGSLIATQGYAGFDLASTAKDANPMNLLGKYKDGALAMVGMNKSTRERRQGIVDKAKEKEKKKSKEKGKKDNKQNNKKR